MAASGDAQSLIDNLDAVQTSLSDAWTAARDAGDLAREMQLGQQADRAADQLEAARQSLLAAIDSGQDVTDLLARMAQVNAQLQSQQTACAAGNADMDEVGACLDGVDKVISAAKTMTR
ncbi:MAG: hypothetical protein JWO83_73 [Caulobacteraceae bacterium]|nr:hypothetical protein [Caulobacteraceae bacterium]